MIVGVVLLVGLVEDSVIGIETEKVDIVDVMPEAMARKGVRLANLLLNCMSSHLRLLSSFPLSPQTGKGVSY